MTTPAGCIEFAEFTPPASMASGAAAIPISAELPSEAEPVSGF